MTESLVKPNPCCGHVGYTSPGADILYQLSETGLRVMVRVRFVCPNCNKEHDSILDQTFPKTTDPDRAKAAEATFAIFDVEQLLKAGI